MNLTPWFFSDYSEQFNNLFSNWIILMLAVSFICFIVSEITANYSQVDKLWSLLPIAYAWITAATIHSPRIIVMSLLVTIWGLRLSYNFSRKGGYNIIPWKGEEDYRWKIMRETPALKGRLRFGLFNLLFISLYQNIVILLFCSPLLLAALNADKSINIIDVIAGILMIGFLVIETIADNHLYEFHREKKNPDPNNIQYPESIKNGFMSEKMWKYVRHPNFTAEQAIWGCFYFFGVAASGKWINFTLAGPILLILIFAGSSRLTENISSGKYPEYKVYQQTVPRFIPGIRARKKIRE